MLFGNIIYKSDQVFGISTDILSPSYVDRGHLDERLRRLLGRNTHVALRGASKSGKSWLRKRILPEAITVQCRLGRSARDLYADALSQLELRLVKEITSSSGSVARLQASGEVGKSIIAKLSAGLGWEKKREDGDKSVLVGHDLDDLRFVSSIINASGRRLVIEDFHYLTPSERKAFAHDLKALWDYRTYVVVIGIWAENNLLLHLNPDLAARITELPVFWSPTDLGAVVERGSGALRIIVSAAVRARLVEDSYGTVGILQLLVLNLLDEHRIHETCKGPAVSVDDLGRYEAVAMEYADQLNALYQTFATRVAKGIRTRQKATGIYAHMLAVVMDADDQSLSDGYHIDKVFAAAHEREPRIQKGNLRHVLTKIDGIQVDENGRGLILTFDESKDEVVVVDKNLFFYRHYATTKWPWEGIIAQVNETGTGYEADTAGMDDPT